MFAVMIFIISFTEFSAIMSILKSIFDGHESANNYSILTVLIATMWDTALCVYSFFQAFENEANLIMFILPTFVLCLLFTNLELRMILLIFQARYQNINVREVICRFNLLAYGGMILTYPILILSNLSGLFFVTISLIFIPQLYHNGMVGHRPSLRNPYYTKFLLVRFLIFVLYTIFRFTLKRFLGISYSFSQTICSSLDALVLWAYNCL